MKKYKTTILILLCVFIITGCSTRKKEKNQFKVGEVISIKDVIDIKIDSYEFSEYIISTHSPRIEPYRSGQGMGSEYDYGLSNFSERDENYFIIRGTMQNTSLIKYDYDKILDFNISFDGQYDYSACLIYVEEESISSGRWGLRWKYNYRLPYTWINSNETLNFIAVFSEPIDPGIINNSKTAELSLSIKINVGKEDNIFTTNTISLPLSNCQDTEPD